ncbi:hypothetical protein ES703_34880 [subsurface metagenome]|nr:AAA family ATPase [Dehalococcoidia bacterium]
MKVIAITGKGGTGKTTIAAFIVRWLSENVSKSILAVDADSNVNLNELLGVEPKETVGGIREEMKSKVNELPGGMTKQQFLEYKIQTSLVETPDFDLIAMGRPEVDAPCRISIICWWSLIRLLEESGRRGKSADSWRSSEPG